MASSNIFRIWILLILSCYAVWGQSTNRSEENDLADAPIDRCPTDYRYRVETCVMEAEVAPQAGGGLALVKERDKLEELCSHGILQKSINCLRDIYNRCAGNETRRQELDMLFSIEDWRTGRSLLCEDLNLFKDHFECMSEFHETISNCILHRTIDFKRAVTRSRALEHRTLHDITCNFAENIVTCLGRPLTNACAPEVVETMTSALHRFLPPACAPVPAVYQNADEDTVENSHTEDEDDEEHVMEEDPQPMIFETVIVEGGDPEN